MPDWVVYILRCSDDSLYTGITNRLEERIKAHNAGKGAKYTKGRGPVELVYSEITTDRSTASKREMEIKKMGRESKKLLLNTQANKSRKH